MCLILILIVISSEAGPPSDGTETTVTGDQLLAKSLKCDELVYYFISQVKG